MLRWPAASRDSNPVQAKYSGWPEVKESLMAGRIQAAYMLAPLVMDLADKKVPVKNRVARASLRRRHHGQDDSAYLTSSS